MNALIQIGGFILIGVVIGVLARVIRPGTIGLGIGTTIAVGIGAALVGGIVASLLGTGSLTEIDFLGFVVAVVVAVIVDRRARADTPPGPALTERVVVVGASVGGVAFAQRYRQKGGVGEVVLIGAERHLPYDRPPLSKKALIDDAWDPGANGLAKPEWYAEQGVRAAARRRPRRGCSPTSRPSSSTTAPSWPGAQMVLATGSRPRMLPAFPPSDSVRYLRDVDDSLALKARLVPGARVVVLGAGFIGLETAAAAHHARLRRRRAGARGLAAGAGPRRRARASLHACLRRGGRCDPLRGARRGSGGRRGGDRRAARWCPPTWWSSASAPSPTSSGWRAAGWRSTAGSSATPPAARRRRACGRSATSHAGPTQ